MKNRSRILAAAIAASLGVAASQAVAQTTWNEMASPGFGTSTLPPGAQEWFLSTFNAYHWDMGLRVISGAEVTTNTVNPGSLQTIVPRLFVGSDADLFKFQIVDPANFSAQLPAVAEPNFNTNILVLFAEDGTALRASRGGGADNAITGAGLGLTPGQYFIGISQAPAAAMPGDANFGQPRNSAGDPLFDFSTLGVKDPIAQADMKLGTDPFNAWTINNGSFLIGPSTFTAPGSTISLTGADFSVVPEPAVVGLAGIAIATLSMRRRRSA